MLNMTEIQKKAPKVVALIALVVVIVFTFLASFTLVKEGYIGVIYQFGRITGTLMNPGPNFHIPFIQRVETIDMRDRLYERSPNAYTKDTQTVENVEIRLTYQLVQADLEQIIRNIGVDNIESKVIDPQVNSILKNAIGAYKAEELVQGRAALQANVENELRTLLSEDGILVRNFSITNIDFDDAFERAITLKVEAEQEALRTQNETVKKEEEAKQKIIAAEAEAESVKIKADAEAYAIEVIQEQIQQSPEYIELQKIEKWNGEFPQVMGNTVNPFITIGE
jgi:regulator of protease activity HflC (stomatin/prohibitin superfamily)